MWPVVLKILYATSSLKKTGGITTFAQFEEGGLSINSWNLVEDKLISYLIDE